MFEFGFTCFSSSLIDESCGFSFLFSSLVKRCLLDTTGATCLILLSLGTLKKMGFLKLKGLSVMKLDKLSLVRI